MAQSVEQMVSDMYGAKAQGADVVEVRLDCITNFQPRQDLQTILGKKPLPVLIVYRYSSQILTKCSFCFKLDMVKYIYVIVFLEFLSKSQN